MQKLGYESREVQRDGRRSRFAVGLIVAVVGVIVLMWGVGTTIYTLFIPHEDRWRLDSLVLPVSLIATAIGGFLFWLSVRLLSIHKQL